MTNPKQLSAQWRPLLSAWQDQRAFSERLDSLRAVAGDAAIESPHLGFYRDAWVGLRCARETGALRLRLGADPPDVELQYAETRLMVEITEVLKPGRRRGDEIREDRALVAAGLSATRQMPGVTWPTADMVLRALADGADSKAAKRYPPETVLALYLNVGDWDNERAEIEAGMTGSLVSAAAAFAEIWIIWHDRFYRL